MEANEKTSSKLSTMVSLNEIFPNARIIKLKGWVRQNQKYNEAKTPYGETWEYLKNEAEIIRWLAFKGWVGAVIPANRIVIDIDDLYSGEMVKKLLDAEEIRHHCIRTPNGYQFIFKSSEQMTKSIKNITKNFTQIGVVIDTRVTEKGYVVFPSETTENRYIVSQDEELDELPYFLHPIVQMKSKGHKNYYEFPISLENGSRNDSLHKFACRLKVWGIPYDQAIKSMMLIYEHFMLNKTDFPEDHIEKLTKSAYEWEPDNPPIPNIDPNADEPENFYKYFSGENGKEAFVPKWLGDEIIEEYPLFYDGNYFYIYKNGVYQRDRGSILGKIIIQKLDKKFKKNRLVETLTYMQNKKWMTIEQINKNNDFINLQNGLLEWKTGVLHPHTPEYVSIVQLPIKYDETATCPKIDKFLSEVLPADSIPTIFEWFGYSLIPSTDYEKSTFLTGSGANGKSVLIKLYECFIGKNNISNVPLQELEDNRFKLAQLYGKLANVFADIPSSALKKTSVFKTVTSGDSCSAEFKGKDSFDFRPYARLLFSANEMPKSADLTDGFFRRLLVFNFPNKFGEGNLKKDPQLFNKISTETELSGLLNKALIGLQTLIKNGEFTINESTIEAIEQYKYDIDPLISFIEDECELDNQYHEVKQTVYEIYTWWTTRSGSKPLGRNKFYIRMEKSFNLKEMRTDPSSSRKWCGIRLKKERTF
ncbi:phage/plasmid primase, P4 family [Bacillaceae bacterium C204]|uniref:phage/plasmid primase, P4 family n=1 Tax=Neobacillus sp. 204 TaxID=3383351 RepID=UPI003978A691